MCMGRGPLLLAFPASLDINPAAAPRSARAPCSKAHHTQEVRQGQEMDTARPMGAARLRIDWISPSLLRQQRSELCIHGLPKRLAGKIAKDAVAASLAVQEAKLRIVQVTQ